MPLPVEIFATLPESGDLDREVKIMIRDALRVFAPGEIMFRISRPVRTNEANKYYWYVLKTLANALLDVGIGYLETAHPRTGEVIRLPVSSEALHYHYKRKYLAPRIVHLPAAEHDPIDIIIPPTTTKLDSTTFYWYVEQIKNDELVPEGTDFDKPKDSYRSYSIYEPAA